MGTTRRRSMWLGWRVRTLVIYRLGSLGDTVVALPGFHRIAQSFPNHRRMVLTNYSVSAKAAPLEAIVGGSGLIDGTIEYPVGMRSVVALWRLARRLQSLRASALIYLAADRGRLSVTRDLLFFRMCGIRNILGASLLMGAEASRTDPQSGDEERECLRLARSLARLGAIDLDDPASWDLLLTPQETARGEAAIAPLGGRPVIAINMGGKIAEKDWGVENWRALIAALAADLSHMGLVVVGAADESARAEYILRDWPGLSRNLCGALSPRETAAALKGAAAFIGHDSGPMHLAASAGVRCVALFGNYTKPRKWHPYGDHHIVHHAKGTVKDIAVPAVVESARRVLS